MQKRMPDHLLDLEDLWMDREVIEEGELRNAWLEEGIRLYKKFLEVDKKRSSLFHYASSNLYLELGREAKIHKGNQFTAYNSLRKATIYSPSKPDAFYHLSFLLAKENRKWEAVVFYGKEALEKRD